MKDLIIRRWFLLTLAAVMAAGFLGAETLLPLADSVPLRYGVVATVLFLMALPLEARAMWRTARRPAAPLLGVAVNSVLLPLFAWLLIALSWNWLLSDEFALGLLVAAATPCTLASAAVWTRRAGGNDAVAIMVTVITNASCFLVTPFWLIRTTGQSATIDASQMIVKLALVVVLPMTLAQLLRLARPIGQWASENKTVLGVIAQLGVLTMIFFGSIQTAHRFATGSGKPLLIEFIMLVFFVVVIHVTMLFCGIWMARGLRLPPADQIAVGFAGSQKTLMVGLQVSMELGFNIVPMVTYHITQLVIDTVIADRFRGRRDRPGAEPTLVNPVDD